MAGLVAANILKRAGHDPLIVESQHRVGGRVHTLRQPFTEGLCAEVGAMRIPQAHELTMEYISRFQLPIQDFTIDNHNANSFICGRRIRISQANHDPSLLGFATMEKEQGCTA